MPAIASAVFAPSLAFPTGQYSLSPLPSGVGFSTTPYAATTWTENVPATGTTIFGAAVTSGDYAELVEELYDLGGYFGVAEKAIVYNYAAAPGADAVAVTTTAGGIVVPETPASPWWAPPSTLETSTVGSSLQGAASPSPNSPTSEEGGSQLVPSKTTPPTTLPTSTVESSPANSGPWPTPAPAISEEPGYQPVPSQTPPPSQTSSETPVPQYKPKKTKKPGKGKKYDEKETHKKDAFLLYKMLGAATSALGMFPKGKSLPYVAKMLGTVKASMPVAAGASAFSAGFPGFPQIDGAIDSMAESLIRTPITLADKVSDVAAALDVPANYLLSAGGSAAAEVAGSVLADSFHAMAAGPFDFLSSIFGALGAFTQASSRAISALNTAKNDVDSLAGSVGAAVRLDDALGHFRDGLKVFDDTVGGIMAGAASGMDANSRKPFEDLSRSIGRGSIWVGRSLDLVKPQADTGRKQLTEKKFSQNPTQGTSAPPDAVVVVPTTVSTTIPYTTTLAPETVIAQTTDTTETYVTLTQEPDIIPIIPITATATQYLDLVLPTLSPSPAATPTIQSSVVPAVSPSSSPARVIDDQDASWLQCAIWPKPFWLHARIVGIPHWRGWSVEEVEMTLHNEEKGCGALTNWKHGVDECTGMAWVTFNLPTWSKEGCVERAMQSAGGPLIECTIDHSEMIPGALTGEIGVLLTAGSHEGKPEGVEC